MNVNKLVKEQVEEASKGSLFVLQDFAVPLGRRDSLEKSLSDLYKAGVLQRISKGLYYKPKTSIFGDLPSSTPSLLGKLLSLYKDSVSYLTGVPAYAAMGLTTQVSTEYTIASDQPRSTPITYGPTTIRFIPSYVKETVEDVFLLQILDAMRDLERIPATTPQEASVLLQGVVKNLSAAQQKELARLAGAYPPSVRAFMGLLLEQLGKKRLAKSLRETLKPSTSYRMPIDKLVFTRSSEWNIR